MDKDDPPVFNRQANSGSAAGLRERTDNRPDRLDARRIADDVQPLLELAVHIQGRRLQVAKAGPARIAIKLGCR